MSSNANVQTQLRIPVDVHGWLKKVSKLNDRSMNAEIVRTLRKAMEAKTEVKTNS